MPTPFYLAINNPPRRSAKRRKARHTAKTSTAKRRRKRATRTTARPEAPPMARKMTAKQARYFGKRRKSRSTTATAAPVHRRSSRRRGGHHSRPGFVDTGSLKTVAIHSAVGAAGFVAGNAIVGKIMEALGKDKPADHWSKKPETVAGVKLAVAFGAYLVGRKYAPRQVRRFVGTFAAGIGTSAGVDGWKLVKNKLPGVSGYFGDSDPITYAPRLTA